jgi:hypothetical protein
MVDYISKVAYERCKIALFKIANYFYQLSIQLLL